MCLLRAEQLREVGEHGPKPWLALFIQCLSGQHLVPAVDCSWVSVRNLGCIMPGTAS